MYNENTKLIDCCTLIADCVKKAPNYEKTGETLKFSYTYTVPVEKIEEAKEFISATFAFFGQPCSRVYISGFSIQTNSYIWTKERIVEQIKNETQKINMILNKKQSVKIR